MSAGLAHVCESQELDDTEVLRRASLERLFRIGANLEGTSPRPLPADWRRSEFSPGGIS